MGSLVPSAGEEPGYKASWWVKNWKLQGTRLHTLTVFSNTATLQVISLRLMIVVFWAFVYTSTSYTLVGLNYAIIIYQCLMLVFWPTVVPALSCRSSRFSPLLMTFSRFCRAIPDTCGMTCHYALLLFMHTHHALTHTHTPTHMHACMHAHIHTHHYTHPPTLPPTHTHTDLPRQFSSSCQSVCLSPWAPCNK